MSGLLGVAAKGKANPSSHSMSHSQLHCTSPCSKCVAGVAVLLCLSL